MNPYGPKTTTWYSTLRAGSEPGDGRVMFENTPPFVNVGSSNRILFIGTNYQMNRLNEFIDALWEKQPGAEELAGLVDSILDRRSSAKYRVKMQHLFRLIQEGDGLVSLCSQAARFWDAFFDDPSFLDAGSVTAPERIVATGLIRDYVDGFSGYTFECLDRLAEIARSFNIAFDIFAQITNSSHLPPLEEIYVP